MAANENHPIIGDVPSDWSVVPFEDVLIGGTRNGIYKPKKFHGSGIKIINMGELFANPRLYNIPMNYIELTDQEVSTFNVLKGDLLFARRSLVAEGAGKCSVVMDVGENTTFESSIIRARPDTEKSNDLFLFYYFKSIYGFHTLDSIRREMAVTGITGSDLRDVLIPRPPVPEQNAIAHVLGTLDDKIEINRKMNDTLEAMAHAIFKSWFVDFDPIRAKIEGKKPYGMDEETAALFPDKLVYNEELEKEIPEGWEVITAGDLIKNIDKGLSYKGDFLSDSGTPMINLGCFLGKGKFSEANTKFYTGEYRERHLIHPGDLVLANTDITQKGEILGSPALVPPLYQSSELIFTHHVYAIRMKQEYEHWREFLYYALLQHGFRGRAEGFATGTTVLALPKDAITDYMYAAPIEKLNTRFNNLVQPMERKTNLYKEETYTLSSLRETLLPKLISGQIRIKDVDRFLEERGLRDT